MHYIETIFVRELNDIRDTFPHLIREFWFPLSQLSVEFLSNGIHNKRQYLDSAMESTPGQWLSLKFSAYKLRLVSLWRVKQCFQTEPLPTPAKHHVHSAIDSNARRG